MEDLSLHILDIAENSIKAGASSIYITVEENTKSNELNLRITDNGKGMSEEECRQASNPFYSTNTKKRIGLGLSLMKQATNDAAGSFTVSSQKNKGTTITATFTYDHLDRKPLGNMAATMIALIASKPNISLRYRHAVNGRVFGFNTREFKKRIKGMRINDAKALIRLKKDLERGLKELSKRRKI